jgi:hypothetical protein
VITGRVVVHSGVFSLRRENGVWIDKKAGKLLNVSVDIGRTQRVIDYFLQHVLISGEGNQNMECEQQAAHF